MTITLELPPNVEQGLLAQAEARGITLTRYLEEIARREAEQGSTTVGPATTLVEFFRSSPLLGLELNLERDPDAGRDCEQLPGRNAGVAIINPWEQSQKGASGSSTEDAAEQSL